LCVRHRNILSNSFWGALLELLFTQPTHCM
jgi:hypothetical protein